MSKFQTTSSALFKNENKVIMPEWMQSFSDNLTEDNNKKLELNFDTKGSFADNASVTRPDCTATPREMVAGFNDSKAIMDAKIELSKFLKGKYYKTSAKTAGQKVIMNTTIEGLQANFTFEYEYENNKLVKCECFLVNDSEYPFSVAGFHECLQDLKTGTLKKARTTIASTRQTYVINREEIVRRFNGSLREATNAINEKLKEGIIVGSGSNSYASFYNPDEIFPKMEKEMPEEQLASFEYVDNVEHVSTNEIKSAKLLSFEAGKIISNSFSDYIINNSTRNNNLLTVTATVLNSNTGIRHTIDFIFNIENEKLNKISSVNYDNETLSINDLLNKLNHRNNLVSDYLKTSTASKHINNGGILTRREIESQLSTIVDSKSVSDFINGWLELKLIEQVGSNTYSTSKSMTELLDCVIAETLSEEEKQNIINYKKKFGSGMNFDRIEQEDTGVREADDIELSNEQKVGIINNELSKKFKNYQIVKVQDNDIHAMFINNGVRHTIKLNSKFNNRKLESITASINGKDVDLQNLTNAFKNNALLKEYVQTASSNNFLTNIIATESNLLERLSQLTPDSEEVLNSWKSKYLTAIGSNLYSSKYTFEELLNMTTDVTLFSEEDKKQILLAKQYFGTALDRIEQKDTGVRDAEDNVTNETLLYAANNYLSKNLSNYIPSKFSSKDNAAKYLIDLFDNSTGLSTMVEFNFEFDNNNVIKCFANVNNEEVSMENIKTVFAMNESLSKYLQINKGIKFNAPMVITRTDLLRKLAKITNASSEEINNTILLWKKQGKVSDLSDNTLASKLSLEQLISMSNIKPLSDKEIADRLDRSRRDRMMNITSNHIQDNDTRMPEVELSSEEMVIRAGMAINGMFAEFDILNAELNDDGYEMLVRIINPINGLKQALKFKFNTFNGKKLGEIDSVSNGEKTVAADNVLELLESSNEAIKKLSTNKHLFRKNNQKNIILVSSLKTTLLNYIDMSTYYKIVDDLIDNGIIFKLDNHTYASEYSFPSLIEYLSNEDKLDLVKAENDLKLYGTDTIVDTNGPIVMDTDNRLILKPEQTLSPKMIETSSKIKSLISKAKSNKKITNNKFDSLNLLLDNCTTPNDIEQVWRELKKYI